MLALLFQLIYAKLCKQVLLTPFFFLSAFSCSVTIWEKSKWQLLKNSACNCKVYSQTLFFRSCWLTAETSGLFRSKFIFFQRFSELFWTHLNLSDFFWFYLNLFNAFWTYLNLFEQIWTYSNLSGPFWTSSNLSKHV